LLAGWRTPMKIEPPQTQEYDYSASRRRMMKCQVATDLLACVPLIRPPGSKRNGARLQNEVTRSVVALKDWRTRSLLRHRLISSQ
jgi:hypothetical protein